MPDDALTDSTCKWSRDGRKGHDAENDDVGGNVEKSENQSFSDVEHNLDQEVIQGVGQEVSLISHFSSVPQSADDYTEATVSPRVVAWKSNMWCRQVGHMLS